MRNSVLKVIFQGFRSWDSLSIYLQTSCVLPLDALFSADLNNFANYYFHSKPTSSNVWIGLILGLNI